MAHREYNEKDYEVPYVEYCKGCHWAVKYCKCNKAVLLPLGYKQQGSVESFRALGESGSRAAKTHSDSPIQTPSPKENGEYKLDNKNT